MNHSHRALIWRICILMLGLAGCGNALTTTPPAATATPTAIPSPTFTPTPSGLPDLLPVPGPLGSFCRFDTNGNLIVTIRNQGTAPAGPSITSIKIAGQFSSTLGSGAFGGTYTGMTPAIPASQSTDVSINVLVTGGTIVSATLTITADSTQQVTESQKNNNTVMAMC
jgi:subtilase family serine protease